MPEILRISPGSAQIDEKVFTATCELRKERSDPTVAFVSKMVAIPEKDLPQNKTKSGTKLTAEEARELARKKRAEFARAQAAVNGDEPDLAELRATLQDTGIEDKASESDADETEHQEPEHLIGFARLFSGTLEVGDEVYVLPPKFSPGNPHAAPVPQKATVTALYLLMGRELESLTSVPPGVVFGLAGLEGHITKSSTLCSQLEGSVNLAGVIMGGEPIVRVALEPENPMDLDKMIFGLRLLQRSDPCAKYEVLENGEHVILTAGELHLERCLKDLRERFARCEIQPGPPIVPYRESIVSAAEMNPPRNHELPRGTVISQLASQSVRVRFRVRPLPQPVTECLIKSASTVRDIYVEQDVEEAHANGVASESETNLTGQDVPRSTALTIQALKELRDNLSKSLDEVERDRDIWKGAFDRAIAFGPRRTGPNILIDQTAERLCQAQ